MVREKMEARESLHQTTLMLTILTLAVFESVVGTSTTAWMMHTQGLSQIIQLRGPRTFHQLPTLAMFEIGRSFILAEGILNRHKIFLADEQWIPRQPTVRGRPMKSQLFDILCAIPSLLADLDAHEIATRPINYGLRTKIIRILDSLFEWRWRWEHMHGGHAYEVVTDSNLPLNLDEHGQPLFPTVVYFSDQLLASDIAHYDGALAYVLRIAQAVLGDNWPSYMNVGGPSNTSEATTSILLLPPNVRCAADVMREIFRLIEFHFSGEQTVSSDAFRLLFPISLAGKGLRRGSDEEKLLRRVRREMADISGFGLFDLSLLPDEPAG
jgi:hypothetical protein